MCVSSLALSDSVATWTVAHQAPLSMEFSRQECWSGLPLPSPGDHPNPGIEPASAVSPTLQVDSLPGEPLGKPYHLEGIISLLSVLFGCEGEFHCHSHRTLS